MPEEAGVPRRGEDEGLRVVRREMRRQRWVESTRVEHVRRERVRHERHRGVVQLLGARALGALRLRLGRRVAGVGLGGRRQVGSDSWATQNQNVSTMLHLEAHIAARLRAPYRGW